jgi:methyltransferase
MTFDSRTLYCVVLGLVVLERLAELVLTRRNSRRLKARGGYEVGGEHFGVMALLHTALLVSAPLEIFLLDRPFVPILGYPMLLLLVLTMALRYWAVTSLGDRWTARVFVVPDEEPVVRGPYRYLRHPNYLAVILEVIALPLIHTAWITALWATVANALMLRVRIRVEERALAESSDYEERFHGQSRLVPGVRPKAGGSP